MHSPKSSVPNNSLSQRFQTALQNNNPRVLAQLAQEQQEIIARLEVQLIRTRDGLIQAKNKHADVNNQIIQANVSFQQALTEANRTIRTLRQEKDDLQQQTAEALANVSSLHALNSALQAENNLLKAQNQLLFDKIDSQLALALKQRCAVQEVQGGTEHSSLLTPPVADTGTVQAAPVKEQEFLVPESKSSAVREWPLTNQKSKSIVKSKNKSKQTAPTKLTPKQPAEALTPVKERRSNSTSLQTYSRAPKIPVAKKNPKFESFHLDSPTPPLPSKVEELEKEHIDLSSPEPVKLDLKADQPASELLSPVRVLVEKLTIQDDQVPPSVFAFTDSTDSEVSDKSKENQPVANKNFDLAKPSFKAELDVPQSTVSEVKLAKVKKEQVSVEPRVSRRGTRINYTEPSLRKKMRREC